MEQKIKLLLGEYTFHIASLQHQLEEAHKEIETLKKTKKEKNERDV